MRSTLNKIALTAILTIATISTTNCSSDDGDDNKGGGKAQYGSPVEYGGETYKTVVIGTQTWMAKNLNYNAEGSKCYNDSISYCEKYGRLYDWATAMALPSECNTTSCEDKVIEPHQGICQAMPNGLLWRNILKIYTDTVLQESI